MDNPRYPAIPQIKKHQPREATRTSSGILAIDLKTLEVSDRRIPRLAQQIVTDTEGILYCLQNSWGKEKQFLTVFEDEVREFDQRKRIVLEDEVDRETIQRILEYNKESNELYLVKVGERDTDPGRLQIIDLESRKQIKSIDLGLNPTDLLINDKHIYVTNFDDMEYFLLPH